VMSYIFGFIAGWTHYWMLPLSLVFFAYPFYQYNKLKKQKNGEYTNN
jgi:hypothetical protein